MGTEEQVGRWNYWWRIAHPEEKPEEVDEAE